VKSRIRSRAVVAAVAGVCLAASLTACSGGKGDAADSGRALALAISAQPPSFDVAQADLGESAYIWSGIYDTLLTVDSNGEVQPNAAESWEYSNDSRTLTLTLRDGLTFSNGDAVTASDVVATLQYEIATPGLRTPDVASIASVAAPDDHTVVLDLKQPDPALLANLATAVGIIGEPGTLGSKEAALNPVGSGPYTLDANASVNGSTYVLNRRDDYWNLDAYPFKTVTVRVIEDSQARFNALQAGEINAGGATADQVDQLSSAGFTVKPINAVAWGGLVVIDRAGQLVPALGDRRVRAAINMAFDRELYNKQLLLGGGKPTYQFYNPLQAGYDPKLDDFYKHDIDGAKKLLAEAGYPDGFSVTLPSSFLSTAFEPAVTQSLADIGITATWEAVPPQEIVSSLSSGKYGLAWTFEGLNAPAIMTRSNLGIDGSLNPNHYTDETLAALLAEAATTVNPDAQAEVYKKINRYSVENSLVVPVVYTGAAWATSSGVEYKPNGAVPAYLRNFGAN
jgi:peptide/nickel transport system substrate-binding protein